jgi:hypothetical protein
MVLTSLYRVKIKGRRLKNHPNLQIGKTVLSTAHRRMESYFILSVGPYILYTRANTLLYIQAIALLHTIWFMDVTISKNVNVNKYPEDCS